MRRFKLKAGSRETGEGIILAFHSKWLVPLLDDDVGVVFRKMGPTWFSPKVVFAYLSAPISSIVARMSVTKYEFVPTETALACAERGKIEKEELRAYASGYSQLLLIEVAQVAKAETPITCAKLSSDYDYSPSSTFIPLAKEGIDTLNALGHFTPIEKGWRRRK